MLLTDRGIISAVDVGYIGLDPFDVANVQPASYDVHLGDEMLWPSWQDTAYYPWKEPPPAPISQGVLYDPGADSQPLQSLWLPSRDWHEQVYIPPGGVALGCTQEILTLSTDAPIAADIAGCSSLGRWFLFVHVTAGFIDPGWYGRLTLELYNASPWWLRIWAGMRIAQLRFYTMPARALRTYRDTGHYKGADTVMASLYKG